MNPSKTPKIAPDLIWRLLDSNAVVVSPRVGEVRVLNGMGTVIWQLLVDQNTPAEIVDHLVENFAVTREEAGSDLQTFFADLTERGVLIWES